MKKIISIITTFIISLSLMFVVFSSVKAEDVNYVPTLGGVQIRTAVGTVKQGFKFTAEVDETVDFENDENILGHGFVIAKGNYTYAQLTTAVLNGDQKITEQETDTPRTSNIVTAHVKGTGNKFSVTLTGLENADEDIQRENFITNITVLAFVRVKADNDAGYEFVFNSSAEHRIRNIAQIAMNTLNGSAFDPVNNYGHLIADSVKEYFLRADVTNEQVVVSHNILDGDNVIDVVNSDNKFVMGTSVDVIMPVVSSDHYSELTYSNGNKSYTIGESAVLTEGTYKLTFNGWNGTAIVAPEVNVESTDILVDAVGNYYSGAMMFKTIQQAVNAPGVKVVYVREGIYENQDITISNSNITLVGANVNEAATEVRNNGTQLVNTKITLAAGVDNIKINGFDFSGTSQINHNTLTANTTTSNAVNNEDFQLLNSSVNVNIASGKGFINFPETAKNYNKNVVVNGCYFTGTTTTAMVYLDNNFGLRVTNTIAENVVFTTSSNGAFVFIDDTSTGLAGSLYFNYNKVSNLSNSSTGTANAIFVDWIGDYVINNTTDGVAETIQINNNSFKNVPGVVFNVANSNTVGLDYELMEMNYNDFDNCGQVMMVRIVASELNRIFKFNYNKIISGDNFKYITFAGNIKDDTRNQVTIDAGNAEGNPTNIYVGVEPNINHFINTINWNELESIDSFVVNKELNETNNSVVYNGKTYNFGIDAFSSISAALGKAGENTTIYVFPGVYGNDSDDNDKNITIYMNGTTLLGAYNGVNAISERENGTVIAGIITIDSGIKDIIIDGFDFTGSAQIKSTQVATTANDSVNNENIQILNSSVNVNLTSGNGFIDFTQYNSQTRVGDKVYNKNITVSGCYFTGASTKSMVYFDNNFGLNFNHNVVENVTLTAASASEYAGFIYLNDSLNGCAAGDLIVNNNKFANITSTHVNGANAIWNNYAGHHDSEEVNNLQVNNNTFENIAGYCLNINDSDNNLKYDVAEMNGNAIDSCGKALQVFLGLDTTYNEYFDFKYNVITFVDALEGSDEEENHYIAKGATNAGQWGGVNTSTIDAEYNVYNVTREIVKPEVENDGTYVVSDYRFNAKVINFAEVMTVTEVVVDWQLNDENSSIEYEGKGYRLGYNAYTSLGEALAQINEGTTVYVMPGTYSEDVTIQASGTTIVGVDGAKINSKLQNVIITSVIKLADDIDNITFDNLTFLGSAKIVGSVLTEIHDDAYYNHENIKLLNSYVDVDITTGDGFLDLPGSNNVYSKDVVVDNTQFAGSTPKSMIFLENNVNITVTNSYFTTETGSALYIVKTAQGRGLAGNIDILYNTFKNIAYDCISTEYIATLPGVTAHVDISHNTFKNINGLAINSEGFLRTSNAKYDYIRFNYNVFDNLPKAIWFVAHTTTVAEIAYNMFSINTKDYSSAYYYFAKGGEGLRAELHHNVYVKDGEVYLGTPDYVDKFGNPDPDETVVDQFLQDGMINDQFVNDITDTFTSVDEYNNAMKEFGDPSVSVDSNELELNEQTQINISGAYESVNYELSQEGIVEVDENGLVTPLKGGNVTITVTIVTENKTYTETIEIVVLGKEYDYVVKPDLTNTVELNGHTYTLGENAFTTIAEAVEAAGDDVEIYVFPGTYNESFTISQNNIKFYGADFGVKADANRNGGTIVTGKITLASYVHDILFDGINFIETAEVVNTTVSGTGYFNNNENIAFENCYVNTTSGNGFLHFGATGSAYSKNVSFNQCYFTGSVGSKDGIIYINNSYDVKVTNSIIENIKFNNSVAVDNIKYSAFLYIDDAARGLSGDLIFTGNKVSNVSGDSIDNSNVIHLNYLGRYNTSTEPCDIIYNNNELVNIAAYALNMQAINNGVGKYVGGTLEMNYNIYNNVYSTWIYMPIETGGTTTFSFNYNVITKGNNNANILSASTITVDAANNIYLDAQGVVITKDAYSDKDYGSKVINEEVYFKSMNDYLASSAGIDVTVSNEIIGLNETTTIDIAGNYVNKEFNVLTQDIVSVDANGIVTPLAYGNAVIEVIVETEFGSYVIEVEITIGNNLDSYVVDSNLNETDNTVMFEDKEYVLGYNAFTTINAALEAAKESGASEKTIYVQAGTYDEDFTIEESNITIVGVNDLSVRRANSGTQQVIITGVITLGAEVDNITIDNIKFTGSAQIKNTDVEGKTSIFINNENITLNNCYVNVTLTNGEGFINFIASDYIYNKNLVITNSYFSGATQKALIYLSNNIGLTLTNNYFTTTEGDVVQVIRTQNGNGLAGSLNVQNNTFKNIYGHAIYATVFATLEQSGESIKIINNEFNNINKAGAYGGKVAINLGDGSAGKDAYGATLKNDHLVDYDTFEISYNIFTDVHKVIWACTYTSEVAQIKYNKFDIKTDTGGQYFVRGGDGLTAILDYNVYLVGGTVRTDTDKFIEVGTKLVNEITSSANITNTYTSVDAYNSAMQDLTVTVDKDELGLNGQSQITITGQYTSATYETSDEEVAVVTSDGVIHAVDAGETTITVRIQTANGEVVEVIYITVLDNQEIDTLLQLLSDSNNTNALNQNINYWYWDSKANADVYTTKMVKGSVNNYYTGAMLEKTIDSQYQINLNYTVRNGNYYSQVDDNYDESKNPNKVDMYGGIRMENVEFIVIHDTGSAGDIESNINYTTNGNFYKWDGTINRFPSSYHYGIDDDSIYQILDEKYVGYHAGEGTLYTDLMYTGIKVAQLGGNLRYRPSVSVKNYNGTDYFYLDDIRTNITVDQRFSFYSQESDEYIYWETDTDILKSDGTIINEPNPLTSSSTRLNDLGLGVFIKDGEYVLPQYHYKRGNYNYYGMRGGANSIGIETSVQTGHDLYKTWQNTAKFAASLLIKYNLTPDRVVFHNNFTNKTCPMTMMKSNQIERFLDMVYVEYMVAKYYSNYTITFSSTSGLVDSTGRITGTISGTTNIPYTITVSDGTTTKSIDLVATVNA